MPFNAPSRNIQETSFHLLRIVDNSILYYETLYFIMKKQKELNHIIVHHTISLRTWTHQTTLTLPIIYIPYSCLKIIGSYRAAKYLMSFSKALDGFYIVQCLHLRYTYLPICLLTIIFIDDSYRTFMCRKMCRKTIARTHVNFHYHHVCVTNCLLSRKSSRTRYFAIFLHTHTYTRTSCHNDSSRNYCIIL